MRPGRALLTAVLVGCVLGELAQAADETAIDEELIEFLGSLDELDEEWLEYLERTDVARVAGTKPPALPVRRPPEVKEP